MRKYFKHNDYYDEIFHRLNSAIYHRMLYIFHSHTPPHIHVKIMCIYTCVSHIKFKSTPTTFENVHQTTNDQKAFHKWLSHNQKFMMRKYEKKKNDSCIKWYEKFGFSPMENCVTTMFFDDECNFPLTVFVLSLWMNRGWKFSIGEHLWPQRWSMTTAGVQL